MSNTQYAVCHLQRGSGNDSGMSCHIERKDAKGKIYVPVNADADRTHFNRELVRFPDGVSNRTEAIQHRIDTAGLRRKVGKNQTKVIRVILTGTHEQMMKIANGGRLDSWIDANLKWLRDTFGEDNLVSCVLHMDEKTPHLHATVVPIVTGERVRRKREGEKKYETKSGPRLSADDVMRRTKLHEYQNSYAAAMKPFGLQRGIVGSTAKHQANSDYYGQQVIRYEEDIAKLQADVEKAQEGRNTILAWFGKGDLARAKKELTDKDRLIAELNKQIKELQVEKARLQERHKSRIEKLRNGYQKEIEAAIHRAEAAERQLKEKDALIDRQRKQISLLDRKANPQRYSLSSGAELVRVNVSNYRNPSLHIWTRVGEELFENIKFQIDYDTAQKHFNGEITDEEFVNAVFDPQEQVNGKQAELLGAVFTLAAGGSAEAHVGTGGGDSSSELPWRDKDKYSKKQTSTRR
ncbi:MAG TPA: plasmid recombination protein [Odoribacter splanchnicus]|uniref:MobV family relaxase n=1 Tax=Barnesiella intestinihominis TaxID=487174 RepID=UPI001D39F14D|nr:MobV family relaxase [Odoribacter splanchnicus]HJG20193.1 plasmid recombination protein [Odoribacter splanchnicus]